MNEPLTKRLSKLAPNLAEFASAALGSAIGNSLQGPDGAATGAIAGKVIGYITKDFLQSHLSPRETERILTTSQLALVQMQADLKQGKLLRTDGFFAEDLDRSDADEILEGILQKAKICYEEKKLPFLASVFSKAAFQEIPVEQLHLIIETAERLGYVQLCLIRMVHLNLFEHGRKIRISEKTVAFPKTTYYYLLSDLLTRGILHDELNEGDLAVTGDRDFNADGLRLTKLGRVLYDLMGLEQLSQEDLSAHQQVILC